MKKNLLFVVIAGLAVMTGCSKNEVIENTSTGEQDKMEFTSVVGKQTRAGEIVSGDLQKNGTELSLYSYKTSGAFANTSTFTKFFENQPEKLTCNGSTWSTAKEYEWTALGVGEKLSIFTYFSKILTGVNVPPAAATANFEYTVPTAIGDQEDLLVATNLDMDKQSAKGVIAINFKHALSQLYFRAKLTGDDYKAVITSIKVLNASNKGKFSYATSGLEAGTWSNLLGSINYIYANGITQEITSKDIPVRIGELKDGSLMLMPQPAKANFQFEVTYNVIDANGAVMGAKIVKTADMAALEMGKKYAYTLILPKSENDKISFDVKVSDWDENENEDVTTEREVRFDEYALTGTDDAKALFNLITGYIPSVIYLQEVKVTGDALSSEMTIDLSNWSATAKIGSKVILDCTITDWSSGKVIVTVPTGWTADNGVSELTTNGKITITKN